MKTAMTELLDDLKEHIKVEWPMNIWLRDRIKKALEKEKEQIMDANRQGRCTDCPFQYTYASAEQYYNETYQNKIIITETKRSIEGIGLNNQNK